MSWRVLGWSIREKMLSTVYGVYLVPILGMTAGGLWSVLCDRQAKGRGTIRCETAQERAEASRGFARSLRGKSGGSMVVRNARPARRRRSCRRELARRREEGPTGGSQLRLPADVARGPRRIQTVPEQPLHDERGQSGLYHSGRLGADMFRYVQQPDGLLITGDDHAVMYWHVFDTLIDLGLANRAENNLTECLEVFGEQPWILERLATVNEIKGRTAAARIFWGAMRGTLFHDDWRTSGSRVSTPIRTPPMSRPFGVYGSRLRRRMYPRSSTPRK